MKRNSVPHFPILGNHQHPIAFAHRGGNAAGAKAENSKKAMCMAYALGYRRIETDAVATLDEKVLAVHGAHNRIEQLVTGLPLRRVLETMQYRDIKQKYRVGGEEIPLLGDLFDELPDDCFFNIDPKTSNVVKPLGELLRSRKLQDRVCIGSRLYTRTQGVAEILGGQDRVCTATGWLGLLALKYGVQEYLEHTNAACMQLPFKHVNPEMVERANDLGLDVHLWTVNDRADMDATLDIGVQGIMSDNIVELKTALQSRHVWPEAA